jgi:hypothetical protein
MDDYNKLDTLTNIIDQGCKPPIPILTLIETARTKTTDEKNKEPRKADPNVKYNIKGGTNPQTVLVF